MFSYLYFMAVNYGGRWILVDREGTVIAAFASKGNMWKYINCYPDEHLGY